MATVKMTAKEIKASITSKMKRQMKEACKKAPDLTDPDALEVTDEMIADFKRENKKPISIRLSPTVLSGLKKTGKKWQTLVDKILKDWLVTNNLL